MTTAPLTLRGHNPDVLTCIANLSNDEVFTPPEMANAMLDLVAEAWAEANDGANIWADPTVTFLDPFVKSGVFLREIVRRLTDGLIAEIQTLEDRVDHILTKQVFGIGITELTALLGRRSVYCSKYANGRHSIAMSFNNEDGNIWFERTEHSWAGGTPEIRYHPTTSEEFKVYVNRRCSFCGAVESELERGDEYEAHAYALIHTADPHALIEKLFGAPMQFDVIVGNPPYQLNDGGYGTSAAPIYQLFVERAKALAPRYLSLVIPSRWFSGGKGLDEFREAMLADNRIREINDFLNASDVFPGIGLKGGVCYFLWDRDNPGDCRVTTNLLGRKPSTLTRPLLEDGLDVFVRFNEGLSILRKVVAVETGQDLNLSLPDSKRFEALVSSRKPFGFDTSFKGTSSATAPGDLQVQRNGGRGYTQRDAVTVGNHLIDAWKLFVGYAAPGTGNRDTYPHRVISTPFVGAPGTISSETYLAIGPFASEDEAESARTYLGCRLTRLLILLRKASQHVTRKVYSFVPTQTWDHTWTDAELYQKYGLSDDEVAFIEGIVRPMETDE